MKRRSSASRKRCPTRTRIREDASGKYVAVDIAPVTKLARPVTLAEIKANAAFKDFPLVHISRLSVMPVTDAEWERIGALAGNDGSTQRKTRSRPR